MTPWAKLEKRESSPCERSHRERTAIPNPGFPYKIGLQRNALVESYHNAPTKLQTHYGLTRRQKWVENEAENEAGQADGNLMEFWRALSQSSSKVCESLRTVYGRGVDWGGRVGSDR